MRTARKILKSDNLTHPFRSPGSDYNHWCRMLSNVLRRFPNLLSEDKCKHNIFQVLMIVAGKIEKEQLGFSFEYSSILLEEVRPLVSYFSPNQRVLLLQWLSKIEQIKSDTEDLGSLREPLETKENPLKDLNINSIYLDLLDAQRKQCGGCNRKQSLYCRCCYIPLPPTDSTRIPQISLPLSLHLILHPKLSIHNRTSIQAKVICPSDVSVYEFPQLPQFDSNSTVILFPSDDSEDLEELSDDKLQTIKHFVCIDSTWECAPVSFSLTSYKLRVFFDILVSRKSLT